MDYEKLQAMALVSFLSGQQVVSLLRTKDAVTRQEAIELYDQILLSIDAIQEQSGASNGVLNSARTLVEELMEQFQ